MYPALTSDPVTLNYTVSFTDATTVNVTSLVTKLSHTLDAYIPWSVRVNTTSSIFLISTDDKVNVYESINTTRRGNVFAIHDLSVDSSEFMLAGQTPRNGYQNIITIATKEECQVNISDATGNLLMSRSLPSLDSLTFSTAADVTGFGVQATGAVAVTSTTTCSDLSPTQQCHPLSTYVPPISRLGNNHIVPHVLGRKLGSSYLIRITAAYPNTTVTLADKKTSVPYDQGTIAAAGGHIDLEMTDNEPTKVECSLACFVVMYLKPFRSAFPFPNEQTVSAPLMLTIPHINMVLYDFTFKVPAFRDALLYSLTIIAVLKTKETSLLLNGGELPSPTWKSVAGLLDYSAVTVQLPVSDVNTTYRLSSSSGNVPIVAYLFVHGVNFSYGGCLNPYSKYSFLLDSNAV